MGKNAERERDKIAGLQLFSAPSHLFCAVASLSKKRTIKINAHRLLGRRRIHIEERVRDDHDKSYIGTIEFPLYGRRAGVSMPARVDVCCGSFGHLYSARRRKKAQHNRKNNKQRAGASRGRKIIHLVRCSCLPWGRRHRQNDDDDDVAARVMHDAGLENNAVMRPGHAVKPNEGPCQCKLGPQQTRKEGRTLLFFMRSPTEKLVCKFCPAMQIFDASICFSICRSNAVLDHILSDRWIEIDA